LYFEIKKKIQNFALPGGVYVTKTREGYFFSNTGIDGLFRLIEEVGADNSTVVTQDPWDWNQIIRDLVSLFKPLITPNYAFSSYYSQ